MVFNGAEVYYIIICIVIVCRSGPSGSEGFQLLKSSIIYAAAVIEVPEPLQPEAIQGSTLTLKIYYIENRIQYVKNNRYPPDGGTAPDSHRFKAFVPFSLKVLRKASLIRGGVRKFFLRHAHELDPSKRTVIW